ncbi:MAG: divalent cation tolerance protein CutA [Candidatus Eremiobacteraeota bacterium]|nr:divalent cation tolerance protein CutA [Candidatus Eremiobacteraeota bacterium]
MRIVLSTCRLEEADHITDTLLKERLIASANHVPGVITKLWWKGEMISQQEVLLILRTREELIWKVEKRIEELNSFEVPEVASIEIKEWNSKYANWLLSVTQQK